MAFATLPDLKMQLRKAAGQSGDDDQLQMYLDSAEQVMKYLVGASSVVSGSEFVEVYRSGRAILARRPLVAVTAVSRDGSSQDATLVDILDANGGVVAMPFGRGWYTVTYTAGHDTVTDNMTLACVIIAQHLWRTQNGGGGAPYPGQDEVVNVGAGYAVPFRALELLAGLSLPTRVGGLA